MLKHSHTYTHTHTHRAVKHDINCGRVPARTVAVRQRTICVHIQQTLSFAYTHTVCVYARNVRVFGCNQRTIESHTSQYLDTHTHEIAHTCTHTHIHTNTHTYTPGCHFFLILRLHAMAAQVMHDIIICRHIHTRILTHAHTHA